MIAPRRFVTGLLAVALVSSASVAVADDDVEEARVLFDQAMQARTGDDMVRAEELLERSLELHASAPTAFNLAEVQMRLGHACAASELYGALLADDFGKLDPPRARDVRRRRRSALRRTSRLTIRLRGTESASVTVDAAEAREAGPGPMVLCVDVGTHRVSASAEGFATAEERVVIEAGEPAEVELTLEPIASDSFEVASGSNVDASDDDGISPWWWVLVGVVVVGAAVGITIALTTGGTDEIVDPVWGNKMALHF